MSIYQLSTFLFLILNLIVSPVSATDETLESQEKALDIINKFADRLCTSVPTAGNTQNVELSGDAKADLNGVLKTLADLRVQGAFKYQESEYEGVLQNDLARLLRDRATCKQKVFEELQDKLIPAASNQGTMPLDVYMTRNGKPHKPTFINGDH